MEPRSDPIVFATTLATEQRPSEPPIRCFSTGQPPTSLHVTLLDGWDLREVDASREGSLGAHRHPIQGVFVRVERHERGGNIRLRD